MSGWDSDFSAGGALLGGVERSDGTYLNTLSASSISTLLTCPEQFRLSYLLQRWGRKNAALQLGNAYHYALQKNFEQKVFSREDMDLDALQAAYEEGWAKALEEGEVSWRDDDPGATKTLGFEMLRVYIRTLAREVHPIAVEERFEIPIPDVPVPLVGRIDLLDGGIPGRIRTRIIDRKTDRQGVTKMRPEWRVQALCYFAGFPKYDFAWHVQSKQGTLRTYGPERNVGLVLYNTPGKQKAARLLVQRAWDTLTDYYERYGLEQPWPGVALAHPYACFSCSHRSGCVWWA